MPKPPLTPRQRAFREQLYIELLRPDHLDRIRRGLEGTSSGYDINGAMQEVADEAVRAMANRLPTSRGFSGMEG